MCGRNQQVVHRKFATFLTDAGNCAGLMPFHAFLGPTARHQPLSSPLAKAALQPGRRGEMLQLLQWLLFGHVHKWKTVRDVPLTELDDRGREVVTGRRYVQQCEYCGKVIKRDFN
ncbi:hypothetical protein [Methylobacterium symbioticum]|nr:hypothetical protein [Methylobacterium symbioticum]